VVELGKTRVDSGVDLVDKVRPRSAGHHSQGGRALHAHRHRSIKYPADPTVVSKG